MSELQTMSESRILLRGIRWETYERLASRWLPVEQFTAHPNRAGETDETSWIRAVRSRCGIIAAGGVYFRLVRSP